MSPVSRRLNPLSSGTAIWEPADLGDRLEAYGLKRRADFAKMIRATALAPSVETDLRIEEVGPAQTDAFAAVNLAAWDVPPPFTA